MRIVKSSPQLLKTAQRNNIVDFFPADEWLYYNCYSKHNVSMG